MIEMRETILELKNIVKTFPGVKALDNVSFDLKRGEVHVLLGENGAGKSTLMKVLAGVHKPDEGEIVYKGEKVTFDNPRQAQEKCISIIYQEFNLMPNLSVAENIFLGREKLTRFGSVDRNSIKEESAKILDFLQADIDVNALVSSLGVAHRQLVEVAKALSFDAEVLIMDEPTATLSEWEIEQLFKTIRHLQSQGVSIIYISHRLQEIKEIGNRVTVLRDGMSVGTRSVEGTELDELITMMVGREVSGTRIRSTNTSTDKIALNVKGLTNRSVRDIDLHVKSGEIVGLSGLVGSGRTELVQAIYGIDPIDSGEVELLGKHMTRLRPDRAIKQKMGFIPEDRQGDGLALELHISKNVTQASLNELFKSGFINHKKECDIASGYCTSLRLNTGNMTMSAKNLSGGNQQKVVLAKWLCTHSSFLIFDEPTRGIDVGAKEEIHILIDQLAAEGVGVLMISSDLPEILSLSDRIYVMREGRIVAELVGDSTSQEEIISFAAGKESAK